MCALSTCLLWICAGPACDIKLSLLALLVTSTFVLAWMCENHSMGFYEVRVWRRPCRQNHMQGKVAVELPTDQSSRVASANLNSGHICKLQVTLFAGDKFCFAMELNQKFAQGPAQMWCSKSSWAKRVPDMTAKHARLNRTARPTTALLCTVMGRQVAWKALQNRERVVKEDRTSTVPDWKGMCVVYAFRTGNAWRFCKIW